MAGQTGDVEAGRRDNLVVPGEGPTAAETTFASMAGRAGPGPTLEVLEEVLSVSKRTLRTGSVRVSTRTESHEAFADLALERSVVEIRRVPIDRIVDESPPVRIEGETTIVPVLEERLIVSKQLVLVEEVHIRRRDRPRDAAGARRPATATRRHRPPGCGRATDRLKVWSSGRSAAATRPRRALPPSHNHPVLRRTAGLVPQPNRTGEATMKWIAIVAALGAASVTTQADAGCLKGALVGGVAGHLAHHGFLGAAAGCAYGVHRSREQQRTPMQQPNSSQVQPQSQPSTM